MLSSPTASGSQEPEWADRCDTYDLELTATDGGFKRYICNRTAGQTTWIEVFATERAKEKKIAFDKTLPKPPKLLDEGDRWFEMNLYLEPIG